MPFAMIRITAGEFRGRNLHTPPDLRTRPTHARLRAAVFNVLQGRVEGARVLDLFAGSGSLGYEALSRGAASVVFVEPAAPALKAIRRNAADLGVEDRVRVVAEPLPRAQATVLDLGPFDLVFADPPYAELWEEKLLKDLPWDRLLDEDGRLILEWSAKEGRARGEALRQLPERTPFLVKIREKIYGESWSTLYAKGSSCSEPSTRDPSTPSP
ncbi:MAG: 16S rRNA (guanine(966)-N(2))-methyltransferase RsmD [Bdellovibrionales bacterium]|nr:16S rRNA (guanine(966)-N(2))-methyltransferase RsmD [Bdellovibrionales bacterium]